MAKWELRTIEKRNGEVKFVPLSEEQLTRVHAYERALEVAAESQVANPPFSKYFVKESIGAPFNPFMAAGNIEYGWCQALHGEESAVAAFRTMYGRSLGEPQPILGIIAGNPERIANPCGNCRDIMLEDLGKDFEVVSAAAEGGMAVVVKMSDYLFDRPVARDLDFEDLRQEFDHKLRRLVNHAHRMENDAYSPGTVHPERRYFAMIEAVGGVHCGAHDVMCEYHPIYALRDAVRQARRERNSHIKEVVIAGPSAGEGIIPHVMYKDRQHLLELNLQGELMAGKECDPPVHLLTYDEKQFRHATLFSGALVGAWTTSVKEWLPFPFSPANFGPEFLEHLKKYYERKDRE